MTSTYFSRARVLSLLLALTVAIVPFFASAQMLVDEDYEDGSFADSGNVSGNAPTISSEQSSSGDQSMKIFLDRMTGSRYRTEVSVTPMDSGSVLRFQYGQEYWIGFSTYLEDWETDEWDEILLQWHGYPDQNLGETWRNPTVAFRTSNDNYFLTIKGDSDPVNVIRDYDRSVSYNIGPIGSDENRWVNWVIRYIPSYSGSNGVFQMWKNGSLVVDDAGINTYNDATRPYLKTGIYKPAWRPEDWTPAIEDLTVLQRTQYRDDLKVYRGANGYDRVATPVDNSSPTPTPTPTPTPSDPRIGSEIVVNGEGSRVNTRGPQNPVTLIFEDYRGQHVDGDRGTVVSGPVNEPSSGFDWWEIDFNGGVDGWVRGDLIEFVGDSNPTPSPTPIPPVSSAPPSQCLGQTGADFVSDFESGRLDLSGTDFRQSGNAPTITQEMTRNGDYAMRTYLNRQESSTSYRTEVTLVGNNADGGRIENARFGEDTWYGFSIFVPEDYGLSNTWEILAQWHDEPNSWSNPNLGRSNPPLSLGIEQDYWRMNNVWDRDPVTREGEWAYDGSYHARQSVMGDVDYGTWTDWVFRIKWSYGNDGVLQVWKNGELVVDRTGPNTYNDNLGPYFKMGLYKGWRDRNVNDPVTERLLYHDDLRVNRGGVYGDVAPECYGETSITPPPVATVPGEFNVGDTVMVSRDRTYTNVRGPQNRSTRVFEDWIGVRLSGDTGTVISGSVYEPSSELTWVEVDFEEVPDGWVREDALDLYGASATPVPSEFGVGSSVVVDGDGARVNVRGPQNPVTLIFEDWRGQHVDGSAGTIIGGSVYEPSSGFNWWNVDFNTGTDGWVRQDLLALVGGGSTPPPAATAEYTAPVLQSVHVVSNRTAELEWMLPESGYGTPDGGYELILNGSDTGSKYGTSNTNTSVYPTWDGERCFRVEAQWTQASPDVALESNEICVDVNNGRSEEVRYEVESTGEASAPVLNSVEVVGNRTAELNWSLPDSEGSTPEGGYELVINGTDTGSQYQTDGISASTDQSDGLTTSVYPTWDGERCFVVQAVWSQFTPTRIESSNELCVTVRNGQSPRVTN